MLLSVQRISLPATGSRPACGASARRTAEARASLRCKPAGRRRLVRPGLGVGECAVPIDRQVLLARSAARIGAWPPRPATDRAAPRTRPHASAESTRAARPSAKQGDTGRPFEAERELSRPVQARSRFFVALGARIAFNRFQGWAPTPLIQRFRWGHQDLPCSPRRGVYMCMCEYALV